MSFLYIFLLLGGISSFAVSAASPEKGQDKKAETDTKEKAASVVAVKDAWARSAKVKMVDGKPQGAKNAGVFMVLKTPTGKNDVLVGGECDFADRVELHTHMDEGGVMKMRPVEKMEVDGERVLKPGGDHVMLMGLKKGLKVGNTVEVTLRFKESGEIKVPVVVKAMAGYRTHCEHKPH